jgi:signal transduction histidine kinase
MMSPSILPGTSGADASAVPHRAERGDSIEASLDGSADALVALLAVLCSATKPDDVLAAGPRPLAAAVGASGIAIWASDGGDADVGCVHAVGSMAADAAFATPDLLLAIARAIHDGATTMFDPKELGAVPANAPATLVAPLGDDPERSRAAVVARWDAGGPTDAQRARTGDLLFAWGAAWQRARQAEEQALEATELRATIERLSSLDRRKDAFVAMVAHELRNPLTPLRLAVGAVRHELTAVNGRPDPRLLDVMERQTIVLTHIVDDLLDLARIRSGKVELRRDLVDVRSVVSRATDAVREFVAQRRHELVASLPMAPLHVLGDPVRLEQAIVNLLTNAAKYTPVGGRIHVGAEANGDHVVVSVSDNGVGIEPRLLPLIFDLFVRVDEGGAAQGRNGLGIGLTVVRDLVALHGGGVEADSDGPGQGSVFRVRLPRADERSEAASRRRATTPLPTALADAGRPRRVLVVDDNADVTLTLAALLESWGHDVRVAHAGLPAVEAASSFGPDLVLLDIGLPDVDGYEVARAIRQRLGNATRIVALTGYAQDVDRERSRRAGFDRHVVKPLPIETLSEIVG